MSFISSLKEKYTQYRDSESHRFLDIKVCMLGARGVGKTSVLASIFDNANTEQGLTGTGIYLTAEDDTSLELEKQRKKLCSAVENRSDIAAIPATMGEHPYYFKFGVSGKSPNVNMVVTDYKGEKVVSDPKYVANKIKESKAIIVALDAPYYMEADGKNEEKNQTKIINQFLIDHLDALEEKLVIFVPLKCEKYFDLYGNPRNDQTAVLSNRVEELYAGAIAEMKKKDNIAAVITPILTVGGVVFDKFEIGSDGKQVATYKFYDGKTPEGIMAIYQPAYCFQPIFNLLSFVARQYQRHRNDVGLIGSIFQHFQDDSEFFSSMSVVDNKRMKKFNGFKVLCGENLFYTNNN